MSYVVEIQAELTKLADKPLTPQRESAIRQAKAWLGNGGGSDYANQDFDILNALVSAGNDWPAARPQMRLAIFAYQVAAITRLGLGDAVTLGPCDGLTVRVSTDSDGQFFVNGNYAGSVGGAIDEFSNLVGQAAPEVVFD